MLLVVLAVLAVLLLVALAALPIGSQRRQSLGAGMCDCFVAAESLD